MTLLRRFLFWSIVVTLVCTGLAGGGYAWYRTRYPFGWSHCCDTGIYFALYNYIAHDGKFPAGEATPEASLSLINETSGNLGYWPCGKSGSLDRTQAILDQGKLLTPDTCGWHYVAGLTTSDDHSIAILWDKEGLGHSGERLPEGGHFVTFVGGSRQYIPAKQWQQFLAEQEVLLSQRKNVPQ